MLRAPRHIAGAPPAARRRGCSGSILRRRFKGEPVKTRHVFLSIFAVMALSLTVVLASGPIPVADTIIARGKVYTGNSERPWAQAVAIPAGKIIAVGDESTGFNLGYARTEAIDAGG